MTHRERLLTALSHKEPDHVPLDLAAHGATGIHCVAYQRLRKHLGLPDKPSSIWHPMQQLADPDEDVLRIVPTDVRKLLRNPSSKWKYEEKMTGDTLSYTDEFGITFCMPKGGFYFDPRIHPLAGAQSVADIENHPWPDSADPARFEGLVDRARAIRETTGAALVLASICPGPLEIGLWLRGFDQFLMDSVLNPDIFQAIGEKIAEIKIRYWNAVLPLVKDYVDVVAESEDLGAQNGLMLSADTYRRFLKPLHTKVFSAIRKHTDAPIFLHSCGAIREVIPDLIESGVNILNPIQVSAYGMDSKELKRDFGADLVFWGGGCDTQAVLSRGTKQQIRDEVKRRIDDLAPGGGFVFTQVHNIQADVPPENILAMWEAWEEFGSYR